MSHCRPSWIECSATMSAHGARATQPPLLRCSEDGFVLQGNRPPIRGRPAIQAAYEGRGEGGPLRLRALAFATADTIGYIIGAYGYGNAPGDTGKFTLTLRRARGEPWLIFSDMDNSNAPPRQHDIPDTPSPTERPEAER